MLAIISEILLYGGKMIDNGYWEKEGFSDGIKIVSAGHIFAKKGRKIERPHGRRDWLLFYVASGNESFFFDGDKKTACPGSFVIFKPGEPQIHICEHEGISEFYYIHFEFENETAQTLVTFETSEVHTTNAGGSLAEAFQQIISELQLGRSYYTDICVSLFRALIYNIKRKLTEQSDLSDKDGLKLVRKTVHEINITWDKALSLENYAEKLGISKFYLSRIFKTETGLSPIAYRNKIRLRHAEEMLLDGSEPVSEISEECGFESAQYFCDAFKKEYGSSPMEYRKQKS